MCGIEFFFGKKDADKYDDWLRVHQNDGFIINNFRKDGKTIWEDKAAMHKASCPSMNEHDKYGRMRYGKLCGLDELALIEDCKSRTRTRTKPNGIEPTKKCNRNGCFKRPVKT